MHTSALRARHLLQCLPLLFAMVCLGCSDVGLQRDSLGRVAVVAGDFDFIEELLDSQGVTYTLYHGYIDRPVYDVDPGYTWEAITDQVESLLTNRTEMSRYNTIFINCGTRGVGERVYNGVELDNQFLADPEVAANLQFWVKGGGRLYLSDWAYDLVELAWPGRVDFYRESSGRFDAAQQGRVPRPQDADFLSPNLKRATIVDPAILQGLDRLDATGEVLDDGILIGFDQDVWAVAETVSTEASEDGEEQPVRVLVRGSALVNDPNVICDDPDDTECEDGLRLIDDAPLMFEFEVGGRGGKVLFTSFHNHSQVTDDVLDILGQVILGFERAEI